MGKAFPELIKEEQLAFNVIKEEEDSFLKTLDQGLVLLDSVIKETNGKIVNGPDQLAKNEVWIKMYEYYMYYYKKSNQ